MSKIRNGFVSNSSSSSFVVLGVPFDKLRDKYPYNEKTLEYENLPKGFDLIYVEKDGCNYILGKELCQSEEYGLVDAELGLVELENLARKLKEVTGIEPKLMMGTRPS